MKILHVITSINRGGAENHLYDLVKLQVAQGLKVTVAYLKGDGYWADALRESGAAVEPLGLRRYGELFPLLRLWRLIGKTRPDVIHAHMPPAELYTRLALLFSPPYAMVITKHNDEPFFRGKGQALVGRWISRRAAHVIAISDAVNRYMRHHLHIEASRITTIHYGIDSSLYERTSAVGRQALRTQWDIPANAWVIGTVARLAPQKALHVLLKAYAAYRQMAAQESRLVLIGRGPLENKLKALAHGLGLDKKIVWAGFREDIPEVMSAFDAFVLPSVYEGFGLVLLEAMAASKPVVASRVSAIPDIVEEEVTGLLCAPGDDQAFARALLRLEQADLRRRFGDAGYKRVLTHFGLSRMADSTLSIYKTFISYHFRKQTL